MLLYIHVPFCRAKCRYCAFYSRPLADEGALADWARAIDADLSSWAEALRRGSNGSRDMAPLFFADGTDGTYGRHGVRSATPGSGPLSRRVTSIFFGGGTPSLLSPALVGRILDRAAREFSLADDIEISMEANPESMDQRKAAGFLAAGVNRVSLGVQALDDRLLAAVGRVHSREDALAAYGSLRRAGFENVGLDFIWGLPGESLEAWRSQISEAASLRPDHLSCYGLTLEEGTPLFDQRSSLDLPSEDTQAVMYTECGEILEKNGYRQYEISNYALPNRECRHNLGYWLGEDYLGLGPSAVSAMQGQRWAQPADLETWLAAPRGQRPAPEFCEELSFREQAEELVMLRLRTARGLPLSEYRRFTGRDFAADNAALIAALEAEGLARVMRENETAGEERTAPADGPRFALTRSGMLISNAIIEQCFENIPEAPQE